MALLAALGHVANVGQFVEIGQGHAHQREQIRWTRRNYALDSQALKIDLLGAARDDVRGTYDTYVERLDSLLLLNALLLPFALNTLQFSDQFVPGLDCKDADHCIEVQHPWLQTLWVYLVGIDLFVPFWSILILLQCKKKLDSWLQQTLDDLQRMRKLIITNDVPDNNAWSKESEEALLAEQKRVVACLGGFIVDYQDLFMELWNSECRPMVNLATKMLWCSATIAITLTAFMFWIYLVDRQNDNYDEWHFGIISVIGLSVPMIALFRGWLKQPRRMQSLIRAESHAEVLRRSSASRVSSREVGAADMGRGDSRLSVEGPPPARPMPTGSVRSIVSTNTAASLQSGAGVPESRPSSGLLERMRFWRQLGGETST